MNIKMTVTHVTIYDRQLKEELTLTVAGKLSQRTCKEAQRIANYVGDFQCARRVLGQLSCTYSN